MSGGRLIDHCRAVILVGSFILVSTGCSADRGDNAADGLHGSERASEVLAAADRQWSPDLDGDGDADVAALVGDEAHFLLRTEQDLMPISDTEGEEITVQIGEQVSFTCQEDGLLIQTFEPPAEEKDTGPLRLSRLDLDGSVGSWTPNPSFYMPSDFTLPDLGKGCPP